MPDFPGTDRALVSAQAPSKVRCAIAQSGRPARSRPTTGSTRGRPHPTYLPRKKGPLTNSLLDSATVTALGQSALGAEPGRVVYADREPRPPGPVQAGPETVHCEHPTLLVFRDEMPGANWMHPGTYALVDLVTRDVLTRIPSDRPPVFGILPETWIVVSDPDGRADLIRRSAASDRKS